MKTLCVMDSISRANGGIFEAEKRLQQTLQTRTQIDVQVVGLRDSQTETDFQAWSPLVPFVSRVLGPKSIGFAPDLVDYLIGSEADLAYSVGLWKYTSLAALRWARVTGKPLIVAPHGMLDSWALRNSPIKKRIARWLFQNAQLKRASCIRALCSAEAASIRAYGLKNPICLIPNGIDLPARLDEQEIKRAHSLFLQGRKVLLYLGRLHPKKGLANLVSAWSMVRREDWIMAIAGWDQDGHEAEIKRQATEMGIPWGDRTSSFSNEMSLFFLGAQFNRDKARCYQFCNAFILPSFSEGVPMAILEAWSYGKPVLMTAECNLSQGFSRGAALQIEPRANSIAEGLRRLFGMSDADRKAMGYEGFALVKDCFSWERIAIEMASVYKWMVGEERKPGCVEIF